MLLVSVSSIEVEAVVEEEEDEEVVEGDDKLCAGVSITPSLTWLITVVTDVLILSNRS